MSELNKLWQLQEIEQKLESLRRRYTEEIDNLEENLKEEKEKVSSNNSALEQIISAIKLNDKNTRAAELDLATLEKKREELKQKLYAGEVRNPKELSRAEQQLKNIEEQISKKEEYLLELMMDKEEKERDKKEVSQQLQEIEASIMVIEAKKKEKIKEQATKEEELINLILQKEKEMPLSLLETYRRVASTKRGIGIAKVKHQTCSACHMELPIALIKEAIYSKDPVFCNNCGRILLVEDQLIDLTLE